MSSSLDYAIHRARYHKAYEDIQESVGGMIRVCLNLCQEMLKIQMIRKWRTLSWPMVVCKSNRRSEWVSGEETNKEIMLDIVGTGI